MGEQTSIWTKIESIAQIGILIFAVLAMIFAVIASNTANDLTRQSLFNEQQATNLTQLSLQLQNMTSNFQPLFIPYSISASVHDLYSNSTLDTFGQFQDKGSLNVSLVVITPHASIINFTDSAFNVTVRPAMGSDDFLNPNNFFGSYVYLTPFLPYGFVGNEFSFYWPEAFVQPGITQLNFTIPIVADIALNSNFTFHAFGGSLGTVNAEVTMFDVQTEKYVAAYHISTSLIVNINWIYG
jgi:hypothetical protein